MEYKMNERIKLLAKNHLRHESWTSYGESIQEDYYEFYPEDLEEFAELIVLECAGLCDKAAEENARTVYTFTETQEVGPALISKGSQVQAEKLSRQIKKHFGVEE